MTRKKEITNKAKDLKKLGFTFIEAKKLAKAILNGDVDKVNDYLDTKCLRKESSSMNDEYYEEMRFELHWTMPNGMVHYDSFGGYYWTKKFEKKSLKIL